MFLEAMFIPFGKTKKQLTSEKIHKAHMTNTYIR